MFPFYFTNIFPFTFSFLWLSFCLFYFSLSKLQNWGFPGGAVVDNLPANAGDTGSSPGLGRSHMLRSN